MIHLHFHTAPISIGCIGQIWIIYDDEIYAPYVSLLSSCPVVLLDLISQVTYLQKEGKHHVWWEGRKSHGKGKGEGEGATEGCLAEPESEPPTWQSTCLLKVCTMYNVLCIHVLCTMQSFILVYGYLFSQVELFIVEEWHPLVPPVLSKRRCPLYPPRRAKTMMNGIPHGRWSGGHAIAICLILFILLYTGQWAEGEGRGHWQASQEAGLGKPSWAEPSHWGGHSGLGRWWWGMGSTGAKGIKLAICFILFIFVLYFNFAGSDGSRPKKKGSEGVFLNTINCNWNDLLK